MNINPSNLSQTSLLALQSKNNSENKQLHSIPTQGNNATKPSVIVSLSSDALSLSKNASNINNQNQGDSADLLKDIFRGVKEQLAYASEAGTQGAANIQEAGKQFQKELDSINKEANGKPLNDQQIERLAKADDSFHKVVDTAYGNPTQSNSSAGALKELSSELKNFLSVEAKAGTAGSAELQKAASQFQKVIDEIAKNSKGGELNDKQIDKLNKADEQFGNIVDKTLGGNEAQATGATAGEASTGTANIAGASGAQSSGSGGSGGGSGGGSSETASTGSGKKKTFNPLDTNRDGKVSVIEQMKAKSTEIQAQYNPVSQASKMGQQLSQFV